MPDLTLSANRRMDVPADVVYACLADYARHHRVGGFLPPAFQSLEVLQGGAGAGTRIRLRSRLGGITRTMVQTITEPEPGRVLVEAGDGVVTRFTVDPEGDGCRVRIDAQIEARGLAGWFTRRFAPGLLLPLYADELRRLEQYARDLASTTGRAAGAA